MNGHVDETCRLSQQLSDLRAISPEAIPGIGSEAGRAEPVRKEAVQPYSIDVDLVKHSVGGVYSGADYYGTCVRVRNGVETHTYTARHVIESIRKDTPGVVPTIRWYNQTLGTPVTRVVYPPGSSTMLQADWAILEHKGTFPKALQRATGHLIDPDDGTAIVTASHPCVIPSVMEGSIKTYQGTLKLTKGSGTLRHTASTKPGSSGGPIILGDGTKAGVVGLHIGSSNASNTGYTLPCPALTLNVVVDDASVYFHVVDEKEAKGGKRSAKGKNKRSKKAKKKDEKAAAPKLEGSKKKSIKHELGDIKKEISSLAAQLAAANTQKVTAGDSAPNQGNGSPSQLTSAAAGATAATSSGNQQ